MVLERKKVIISAGYWHTVGLKSDGTCVAVGDNSQGPCNVTGWTDIVAIVAGWYHTVGLKSDGTCVAVGDNSKGQCNVTGWTDIVAIAAGGIHTVGLKSDGTCVAVGNNSKGPCNVTGWKNIVAIAAGYDHTVGLKSDGTCVAVGNNSKGQCNVTGWTDIVAIAAGGDHTVGLKSDGTCVAVGNYYECNVTGWTDIVAIAAGNGHTVGLKSDGTCVAVGRNAESQCNVTGWTDIVAIAAGGHHTVGLKSDGTCVAVGDNDYGQHNITGWILATYDKKGLLTALQPLNFLNKSRVTGFNIAGIEPANTSRHVAFKVDDVWNKLTVSSGTAELTALETQEITADSLIAEGNTVAELQSVTDCTPFVGKLVYPAVALYADSSAEVMPTFGMTVNALIDTTVNVYEYVDYSQEYTISESDDVNLISLVATPVIKGSGKVNVTARIKTAGEWTNYMPLSELKNKQATAIQLKAEYSVLHLDGSDSAKLESVVIKYSTSQAITTNEVTELVTITQKFTNDLLYVHAYCKHDKLIDSKINAYCSIRKKPLEREMYQFGNGTGSLETYTLPDSGIDHKTLKIFADGTQVYEFDYNTGNRQLKISATDGSVLSASYEYGWEPSQWYKMEQGETHINKSGEYTTEYTYVVPAHNGTLNVSAVKFELKRISGTVNNERIGIGTGKSQIIKLKHKALKETIICNGKWSYDYDKQLLTIIAPDNEDIIITYSWIGEQITIHSIAAGWAD